MLGLFAALAGAMAMAVLFYFTAWAKDPVPAIKVDSAPIVRDARAVTSFAPVVKKAAPSVVNIYSTHIVHERLSRSCSTTRSSAGSSAMRRPVRTAATSATSRAGKKASAPESSFPPTDIF